MDQFKGYAGPCPLTCALNIVQLFFSHKNRFFPEQ